VGRLHRKKSGLTSVQALRGLAALGVVLYHTSLIMRQPQYGSHSIWPETLEYGKLGVNLFFVLSGFIILKAHIGDAGQPSRLSKYLYRRVVRIYPVYWIFLTLYILAAAVHFGFPDFSWAPGSLLQAYTLLPLNADIRLPLHELILPLKVAWTLAYEIEFYLLFVIAIFSARLALIVASIWLVAILVQATQAPQPVNGLFSTWNLYFLAGMAVLWLSDRIPMSVGHGVLAGGLILWCICPMIFSSRDMVIVSKVSIAAYFVLAFALILLGSVTLERRGFVAPVVLQVLGDASYSIYLVHSAAISGVLIFARPLQLIARIGPYATYFLVFLIAVAAGVAAYFLIERPLLRSLRKFTPMPRDATVGQSAASEPV
jgi:exopolysaccharide production protein ExoZ